MRGPELVHLKAIEAELSGADASAQTTAARERPEVLQALETAATVTRQAIEIEELTARCDSYMRALEAAESNNGNLERELSQTTSERNYYREAFFSGTRAAEAIERIITQWRAEAHTVYSNRPNKSYRRPDDGERIPAFLRDGPAHKVTSLRIR